MKTNFKKMAGLMMIALLFTACAKAEESTQALPQASNQIQQNDNIENVKGENPNAKREQGPENGKEEEKADLYGKVKSIIGNEIVLELAEIPAMPEREENKQEEKQSINQIAMGGGGQGPMPGGMPGGQRNGGNAELNLTGETQTIMIPVGVPITSLGQKASNELDIGDVTEGSILQIWFDKDDSERVVKVRMMQGR
ncbi:hypothetical protein SAMN05446037_101469 [Anaerovirgula multivorans]|uniref:Lipoprotein n=1 Tax=Anaerovirgula multivorans TaxID=312168 RepID=A0A239FXA1_9FIRM|nr:hypothetical protein [Anaerovirgula multivorans]SNS61118.1 hypothetical protein SAMN05446037_101469 [Anaerovirgula multivorans]